MFKNYFIVGIRNIIKYKAFSFIHIFGLAVAMSVCMLIILMLADQMRYDQFHAKKDRIYRILSEQKKSKSPHATTPVPLASTLKTQYPIIEDATSLITGIGGDAVYNQHTVEVRGFFADTSFFNVFSYELEGGSKSNALVSPNSMVITRKIANNLFQNENPIGKTVAFMDRGLSIIEDDDETRSCSWGNYTITGVITEKDYKSHLKFDVLFSSSSLQVLYADKKIINRTDNWADYYGCYTYILLDRTKSKQDLTVSLDGLAASKYTYLEDFKGFKFIAQELTKISPGPAVGNPPSYSMPLAIYYFLSFLALVIMISACLNYTNLSIAKSLTRSKEIGVRKVAGASRKDLVFQFLSESIITAFLALIMAGILLIVVKHAFLGLWINKFLNFELKENIFIYFVFTGFALLVGIIAGIYPAVYLSKYKPITALKNIGSMHSGKFGIRKVLSVSQFVISLFFIITSILILKQFRHFLEFEYGFNARKIVNITLKGNNYHNLSNEFNSIPGVSVISACEYIPATGRSVGIGLKKKGSEEEYKKITLLRTDDNFVDNLELRLIAGRNLPAAGESSERFILLNEKAAKELGYDRPSDIIGQLFDANGNNEAVEVVGVVADFRFRLLINEDKIGPLVMRNQPDYFKYANVKVTSNDLVGTIAKLEVKWKNIDPVHSFTYEFFDEQLAATHRVIFDVVSILGFIAFLAVTIACLGLLGMATYSAERRKKEVGIRKVLGAGDYEIVLLLSKEFLGILAVSICIAAPLSYVLNNFWLQNLPNRVSFGFDTIVLGVLILLMLGLITIGSQTMRASKSNPIDSLKMD